MIFRKIAEWFTGRKRSDDRHPLDYINNKYNGETATVPQTPQKVEATPIVEVKLETIVEPTVQVQPEPTKCGCGRSPTGLCVGLHRLTEAEWAVHADNPKRAEPAKEAKRPRRQANPKVEPKAEKKPAAKKEPAKKPAAKKEPVKPKKEAAKKAAVPVRTRPTKKAKSV